MQDDYKPILFNTPKEYDFIRLYFLHDIHKGSELHDEKKFDAIKKLITEDERAYCVVIGDTIENAIPNSKSDVFYQTLPPHEQKEWIAKQLSDLDSKVIAVVDGNHERNRSTKVCGMFPLYDACAIARIENRYRPHFALVDIGVGERKNTTKGKQVHYVGYVVHQAKNQVHFGSPDMVEGIDFFVSGHDHQPTDRPRGKLIYDTSNKTLRQKDVEYINCGAFMSFGGYGSDSGRRPTAQKMYTLILDGKQKECGIRSEGFHVPTRR